MALGNLAQRFLVAVVAIPILLVILYYHRPEPTWVLIFVDVLWPEFRRQHLFQCLEQYAARERRFGLTSGQLASDVESG